MKRSEVLAAQGRIRAQIEGAGLTLPADAHIEVADFGLGHFEREGLGIVVRVNEPEYCSKWLTLSAGQECPLHSHHLKKETFFVLQGEVHLWAEDALKVLSPGMQHTLAPGVRHRFGSPGGAVIEEVSTHDENQDSYFENKTIVRDPVIEED